MQVYLTTQETTQKIVIDGFEFKHPVINRALIEPDGFMTLEEFRKSDQFPAAVADGHIVLSDEGGDPIVEGHNVTRGAIAVFEDQKGSNLVDSSLVLDNGTIRAPYSINLTGEGQYTRGGESIHARDLQTSVLLDEIDTGSTTASSMISLTSRNTVDALYNISFEGLIWVSKNNRTMGLGLSLNGVDQPNHYIEPRFNRANDHRVYSLTANLVTLPPESLVDIRWERVGSSATFECNRRTLTIEQILI